MECPLGNLSPDRELPGDYAVLASFVMPGSMPGIHDLASGKAIIVDGRAKPGHDWEGRGRKASSREALNVTSC
jgi:hypothetical protein